MATLPEERRDGRPTDTVLPLDHPSNSPGAVPVGGPEPGAELGPEFQPGPAPGAEPEPNRAPRASGRVPPVLGRLAARAHLVLPAALTLFLGFDAGGFFPWATGVAALVVGVALLGRLTLARAPLAGWSRTGALAAGGLGLYAAWTLLSAMWSGTPGRALLEFDRALLYALAVALFATFPRRPGDLGILLRWVALAMVAIAAAGLATRLFPGTFEAQSGGGSERLADPLTYWNAQAVLCALGAVLAVHVASGRAEPVWARVPATAAIPLLAMAGYFPFSRGGVLTAVIGLGLYAVLAHPRRGLLTLLVAGPATFLALRAAYGAEALATRDFATGAGPAQGREVALVLGLAMLGAALARVALLPLERRLDAVRTGPRARRAGFGLVAVGVVALVVAAAVLDAPGYAQRGFERFAEGSSLQTSDPRDRFSEAGNNGRSEIWRVALDVFATDELKGTGAGTFRTEWDRLRPTEQSVVNAHSLYLELMADLGLVGLGLFALAVLAVLATAARRLRGPERHAHAAVLAAGLALLIHAGVDWDFQMPVLFVWLLAAGGVVVAAGAPRRGTGELGRLTRVVAGLALLGLLVTPFIVVRAQPPLDESVRALRAGDCRTAVDGALDSLERLRARPEPYVVLGYCNLRARQFELGLQSFRTARARDARDWQVAYGLTVATALNGSDPRPAAREMLRLNPRERFTRDLHEALAAETTRRGWARVAARTPIPFR